MKINVKNCDSEKARALSSRFGIPLLAATVMARRGIGEDDMCPYLEESILYQHSPFTSDDVYTAVERINSALMNDEGEEEKILIFGDRDVDGVTATAIMYRTLKKLGATKVGTRLPHGDESYGLTMESVEEIRREGYSFVITVDNGISAVDEILELEKSGIDVIVLDHHIPGEKLPPAVAIFDPKIEGSGYPFPHLAGCAVAAKLAWALHFSRTPLWNSSLILLHAEPGNGTVRVSAARLEDLRIVATCHDEFVEGGRNSLHSSPLLPFLSSGVPVLVLDRDTETATLRKVWGRSVELGLEDFRPRLDEVMPRTRGKSLFELATVSRAANYGSGGREMETLVSLFRSMSLHGIPSLSREFCDISQLSAIGTIADLMPMRDENLLIVKEGLRLMTQNPLPCLRYLLSKQNVISQPVTAQTVSFKISPVLNAAGRLGMPEDALALLLSEDWNEIEELTERLIGMNRERQKNEEDAMSRIRGEVEASLRANGGKFIIVDNPSLPRGLTGSISSRLSQEYGVPAIVLAEVDDKISGSMRCRDPWAARDFLSNFSHLFDDYGGHRYAAGLRMDSRNKEEFIISVEEYVSSSPVPEKCEMVVDVDAVIPPQFMGDDVWKTAQLLSPSGQENPDVLFHIPDAVVEDVYHVGNNPRNLRFTLRYGAAMWPAVWWNAENTEEYVAGRHVRLVFTAETNWWRGVGKKQLSISYMEAI